MTDQPTPADDVTGRLNEAYRQLAACATADDVADLLRENGIKGERVGCKTCPVAVFLARAAGVSVQVGISEAKKGAVAWVGNAQESLLLGRAVKEFVRGFDQHSKYADLAA